MALLGQLDDKPAKAGKKQNPFMQFLSMMNPYSDTSKPPGEFDENFSRIVSAMGPGMGMDADAATAPGAPGAAAAGLGSMVSPATAGGPVGGFSSAMEGEVGGMTVAPTAAVPGVAGPVATPTPPGQPPYVSQYFRDRELTELEKKAERTAQYAKLSEIFTGLKDSLRAQGIDTIEKLEKNDDGFKIVQELMFLAGNNEFKAFDELDEIYAALGLQAARSPQDQFNNRLYELRNMLGSGTLTDPADIDELERLNEMERGPQTRAQEQWNYYKKKNTNEAGVLDMEQANKEFTAATAKEGTQGYSLKIAVNPSTGRNEFLKVNNRTGDLNWTGIGVPSDFSIDKLMSRNPSGYGPDVLDGRKIRFYHESGEISDDTLKWLVNEMPDTLDTIGAGLIENPEKVALLKYIEELPTPPELSEIETIKQFAVAKGDMSYEEARTELERLGLKVREPGALGSFRRRGGG